MHFASMLAPGIHEVTAAAALGEHRRLGDHRELGAGRYLVPLGEHRTIASPPRAAHRRVSCSWATWPTSSASLLASYLYSRLRQ